MCVCTRMGGIFGGRQGLPEGAHGARCGSRDSFFGGAPLVHLSMNLKAPKPPNPQTLNP